MDFLNYNHKWVKYEELINNGIPFLILDLNIPLE